MEIVRGGRVHHLVKYQDDVRGDTDAILMVAKRPERDSFLMDGPCRCFLFFIKLFFYASFSSFLLLGLYRFALLVLLLHLLRWLYLVALVLFRRIFFGIPLTDIKFSQDSGTFIFIYLFFFWNIFASILEDAWRILWRCSRPIMAIDYFLFISVVNDRNLFNEKSPLDHFLIDDILRPIRSNFLIQFHYYSNKLN